jgi:hypothetical protein
VDDGISKAGRVQILGAQSLPYRKFWIDSNGVTQKPARSGADGLGTDVARGLCVQRYLLELKSWPSEGYDDGCLSLTGVR